MCDILNISASTEIHFLYTLQPALAQYFAASNSPSLTKLPIFTITNLFYLRFSVTHTQIRKMLHALQIRISPLDYCTNLRGQTRKHQHHADAEHDAMVIHSLAPFRNLIDICTTAWTPIAFYIAESSSTLTLIRIYVTRNSGISDQIAYSLLYLHLR